MNMITESVHRLKTKDKRQKTAPGNCLIYPSFIHSLRLHLAPSKRHFPTASHIPHDGINGISHIGINGISHIGISHDIFPRAA